MIENLLQKIFEEIFHSTHIYIIRYNITVLKYPIKEKSDEKVLSLP